MSTAELECFAYFYPYHPSLPLQNNGPSLVANCTKGNQTKPKKCARAEFVILPQ